MWITSTAQEIVSLGIVANVILSMHSYAIVKIIINASGAKEKTFISFIFDQLLKLYSF